MKTVNVNWKRYKRVHLPAACGHSESYPRYEGEDDGFVDKALRQKGISAEAQPEISLESWSALLRQANEKFPLLNLHFEKKWPDTCYIGEVLELSKKRVTLRHIDPGARWGKNDTYDLKDLTRVDFGDGYSRALWSVARHNTTG